VTAQNGCSVSKDILVPGTAEVVVKIDADLSSLDVNGMVKCSLTLNIPIADIDSIIWISNIQMSCVQLKCLEQEFTLSGKTEIEVRVVDIHGCSGQAFLVLDLSRDPSVYIPNVFSPNGDGTNDQFTLFTNDQVREIALLEIFDRWGDLVFANSKFPPNEPDYGWDGYYHSQLMNPDVFAYRAVVLLLDGSERAYHGDVTLIR
ncbi:MAG TPA: gliding motility-associated C-terminal domain-containing protein, partial [Saprospiraceae bacterium]|nr:gliding motility-associated C-terminal domain-containing protein [Saprospiraceae bacterium]